MSNVSDKSFRKNQNTRLHSATFFFNGAVYQKMWKTTILPGRPQMTGNMAQSLCMLDT
jgi:hypothetical protein